MPSSSPRCTAPGVTATASARDRAFVAGLGASDVLDYTGRFEDQVRDLGVVVNPVGGNTTARSWQVLRSDATLVAIPLAEGRGGRDDVCGTCFVVRPGAGQLRELALLIDGQQLRPVVSAIFELAALPEAFRAQPARGAPGKVVISVEDRAAH